MPPPSTSRLALGMGKGPFADLCVQKSVFQRDAPKGFVQCDSWHLEPAQAFLCPQAGQVKRNGAQTKACPKAQGSNGQASNQLTLAWMIFREVA